MTIAMIAVVAAFVLAIVMVTGLTLWRHFGDASLKNQEVPPQSSIDAMMQVEIEIAISMTIIPLGIARAAPRPAVSTWTVSSFGTSVLAAKAPRPPPPRPSVPRRAAR
jgi:hypothetical protein